MENLTIISTSITVQAKQIINGNTANFAWNYLENQIPNAINFNIKRGLEGSPTYLGNIVISGAYYPDSEKYDIQNNSFQDGDFDLYQNILTTCKEIVINISNNETTS